MSIYNYDITNIVANITPPKYRLPKWLAWLGALLIPLQWLRDNFFNESVAGSAAVFWSSSINYTKGTRVISVDLAVYEAQVSSLNALPELNSDPANLNAKWRKVSDDFRGMDERKEYNGKQLVLEWILNKYFNAYRDVNTGLPIGTVFRQPTANTPDDTVVPNTTAFYTPKSDIYIYQTLVKNYFLNIEDGDEAGFIQDDTAINLQNNFIVDDSATVNGFSRIIYVPTGVFASINTDPVEAEKIIRAIVDRYNVAGVLYTIQTY